MPEELTLLYLALAALYLLECAAWPRLDDVAFVGHGGRWIQTAPRRMFGAVPVGLVLAWPLPPLGTLLLARRGKVDPESVRVRLSTYGVLSRPVRVACNAVLLYLFIGFPGLIGWGGMQSWPLALVILVALTCATAIAFALAHRSLYPNELGNCLQEAAFIALVPTVAARAHDRLSRPLLQGLHPIAVAAVLCQPEAFRLYARKLWLEALHPRPGEPSDLAELQESLARTGLDVASLSRPPARTADNKSFCERCEAQYTVTEGHCADCPWMELARF